ncbi:MAG: FG-GAP-like repeat-containing protein [Pyrinomonadaceae bacterium]|nr:FG-GAP-like repeat-containing protein [Pyrinomonadaceae bacterium]
MKQSQVFIKRTILFSFAFLLLTVSFLTVRAAGEIDPTFNGGAFAQPTREAAVVARQPDGKILIGGNFVVVNGFLKLGIVRLNADDTLDTTFNAPPLGGTILAFGFQTNGKIIVGGEFISSSVLNIIRLNADGSRDTTFTPPINVSPNRVNDLVVRADDKILVGGGFQYFPVGGGSRRVHFARLNANGTNDDTFIPAMTTVPVQDIEVQPDGKIVGVATGGGDTVFLRRFNADGSDDAAFTAAITTPGGNGQSLFTVKVQANGKILIGGSFTFVNNTAKVNLARLNADGSLDETFNTTSNGAIYDIEIGIDGKILVAGSFQQFNGSPRRAIVRLEDNGTLDGGFNFTETDRVFRATDILPLPDGNIIALLVKSNALYTGAGVVRLTSNGTVDTSFSILLGSAPAGDATGSVSEIVQQTDGKILVAGSFGAIGNFDRARFARFNADGTADTTFNPVITPDFTAIRAVAVQPDGKILVGGNIFGVVLRLNPDGSRDTTFNVTVSTANIPYDIAVQPDGKIIAVGLTAGGSGEGFVYRFNQNGSLDSAFQTVSPNFSPYRVVVQPDGKIFIGGDFTLINGTPRGRIARLNADGTLDTTFNPLGGANSTVSDFAVQTDGKVVIGGNFNFVNGTSRSYIARLNANGSFDATFAPVLNQLVYAIRIQPNGKILIGGGFFIVNNVRRDRLARLNPDGTLDSSFNIGAGADGIVYSLALQTDGKILVGGDFLTFNSVGKVSIVRLLNDSATRTPFDFDGDGRADVSVFRPSNATWYLQQSTSGFAGSAFGLNTDKLVPADYDGDGKTDLAVYRGGIWYIQRSSLGFTGVTFGDGNDIPVPADYDGDGRADVAVFRPSNATWYLLNSTAGVSTIALGIGTDKPVPGDYNGDGRAEIAVFRPSTGYWYLSTNPATNYGGVQFGVSTDVLVPADYDGDGKTDIAVFRPSNGTWYLLRSQAGFAGVAFGFGTDLPVPADYDGDGKADIAVFRNGTWYLNRSSSGFTGIAFGFGSDQPIPNTFVR